MKNIVIIGGGLSGLATAYDLQQNAIRQNQSIQLTIIEKETRVGGKIWSHHHDGYLYETGANGFLTNKPATLELCKSLGLENKLLTSNDNARKRFVVSDGKLHKLPHGLLEFLKSDLLSGFAKFRIVAELFIKQRNGDSDESLASFAKRRLGSEAYHKLIEPMANGIFAGNPEEMSLKACFPRLYQLEHEHGGLLKGFLKLVKKHDDTSNAPDSHKAVLTSFIGGTQTLIAALYDAIGEDNIIRNDEVLQIYKACEKWAVTTKNHNLIADEVVFATPSYITANLLKDIDETLANKLLQIKYAPLAIVCLGFDLSNIKHDINGFGYLFANKEESPILGTLWESSIFVNRAPDNKILFRSMLGGASNLGVLSLSDVELYKKTQASLYKVMNIDILPEFKIIFRHENAIPQYQLNHCELVESIENLISKYQGLHLVGNAYHGVAINDCVYNAKKLANTIINSK